MVVDVSTVGPTGVGEEERVQALRLSARSNPLIGTARIARPADVTLSLFDLTGAHVAAGTERARAKLVVLGH